MKMPAELADRLYDGWQGGELMLVAHRSTAPIWAKHYGVTLPDVPMGCAVAFISKDNGRWRAQVYRLERDEEVAPPPVLEAVTRIPTGVPLRYEISGPDGSYERGVGVLVAEP